MKYYAVTNDPTELMHFGIKGMHWGIIRTDAQLGHPRHSGSRRPRSAAYKRAQSKLGAAMKNGIEKAKANWREYNSPERKYERQTNRALQQARKGKLKYGKLDDWQVQRITDRLAMERNARMLSNTEKTWGKKLLSSVGEGVISGVGHGVDRRMSEWISRGSTLKTDRKRAEQQEYFDARKDKRKIENARKEAEAKLEREFKQKQREDEYNDSRERAKEDERVRNSYEFGASYDKDGKLDYTDRQKLDDYYERKYINGESRTDNYKRQYRESMNHRKEQERQARLEATRRERDQERQRRLAEEAREKEQRRADAKERERYRKNIESLSKEASKRDAERAWKDKQSRIADRDEREAYRRRLSETANSGFRISTPEMPNSERRALGFPPERRYKRGGRT